MYLVGDKFYITFDELDDLEEKFKGKEDILSLEKVITEEDVETFIKSAKEISKEREEEIVAFLFYIKEKIEENERLYRHQKRAAKAIDNVLNRYMEVIDKEEIEKVIRKEKERCLER